MNGSDTELVNNGTITTTNNNGGNNFRAYGVISSSLVDGVEFEGVKVTNGVLGQINVTQTGASGTGRAIGIYAGEGIESMTIDNFGLISVSRSASSTQALGGIDADDDTEELVVNNHDGANIKATGNNAYAVGGRAQDYTLNNDGTITGNTSTNNAKAAIMIFGGGDEGPSSTTITNSATGKILGDVFITDVSPVTGGTVDDPEDTRDSSFVNKGLITGSFTYGNGTHTLDNSNEIDGGITVNQTADEGVGGASFTLTNEGILGGNITIHDRADSENSITLIGDGFGGNVTADGNGSNSLALSGVSNIGTVKGITSLDLGFMPVTTSGGITLVSNPAVDDTSQVMTTISGAGGTLATPSTALGSVNGTLTLNGTNTVITPTFASLARDGDVYQLASTVALGPGVTPDTVTANSTFLVSTAAIIDNNQLLLQTSVADAASIPGISKPAAATLNSLLGHGGSSDAVGALGGAVENLQTAEDVAKVGAQLSPDVSYATQQAAITLNNALGQHIDTRLASVGATGTTFTPYTPGPSGLGMKPSDEGRSNLGGGLKDDAAFVAPRSAAMWAQGFGASMDQNSRDLVDGYDARLYGIMAGYDNWVSPNMRLGIAGGYANTTIDGNGFVKQNETDIDSYLLEAYGSIKGAGWYATGRTGFTWHNFDTSRVINVPPVADTAKGSHDGTQYNAAIEFGAPMRAIGATLTPVASLTYSHLNQDGYTETSGAGAALTVASQSNDSVVSGLGLKALVPIANDTVLEGRAQWLHEFSDTAQIVTAAFAGGGGTFTAAGPNVGRDSADLGVGLLAQIDGNMRFEMNYDANVRPDYLAHVGSARLMVDF